MPPMIPKSRTANISELLYVTVAALTSYIIRPPSPNNPQLPEEQSCIKALKTIATTAVVKNVLQRRALRHLKGVQTKDMSLILKTTPKPDFEIHPEN